MEDRAIVTSADEEEEEDSSAKNSLVDSDSDDGDLQPPATAEDFFDENADHEDEAYVYKYLRSGRTETVQVKTDDDGTTQPVSVLKPRHSDAVLSCPCCFQIVCMDCQRHERYDNQFRAMFVMGILVRWDQKLRYDDIAQGLVPFEVQPNHVPPDHDVEHYYVVCCSNCQTQVAALDTKDEVYHFYDCLASS